jgi:trimethylamine--corrinoid protein Co-methyltransferase
MAAAIVIYAKNNQPIILDNFVVPGATWPLTLVGNIVLRNAEILSGLELAQIVNPGLPIIFGCSEGVNHMGNDKLSIRAPERSMFVSAIAQMAKFYGVQGRSGGNRTYAHIPNMQAGIESAISLYSAIKSGVTFLLHSCGILGTYSSMSYEKFVIDEEIIAMVKRMMKPINISKQKIDLDRIGQVGLGEENLFDSKSFELFRDEHFQSKILNRLDYKVWEAAGKKGIPDTAKEIVKNRIESYEKPEIDRMSEK